MSMQGSSALTSFTASRTRSSITGAVVSVTCSETQSAPPGVSLLPRMAKNVMKASTSTSASPPSTKGLPERRTAAPELSAVSGAVESS